MKAMPSRRDQILHGMVATADRTTDAASERRSEGRSLPLVGTARPMIGSCVGLVTNASERGAAVLAEVSLGAGDNVPVKFHGRDVIGARIAWKRGRMMGLVFPKNAFLQEPL